MGRLRGDAPALATLVALVFFLFSGVIVGGRVFYDRDIHLEFYSQVEGFVRSVAAGAWPVWDNTLGFGQSLMADPSAEVAYPLTWLNFLVQPWDYYTVFVLAHCFLAAFGMYFLARRLGLSLLPAIVTAALWTASGPLLSLVNVWHHFAGACWVPLVALAAVRAIEAQALGATLAWGAAVALQVATGSAEMVLMGACASGALLAARFRWRPLRVRPVVGALGRVVLATAIAVGLAAIVWLPAVDAVGRSSRAALPEETRTAWSVPPLGFVRMLLPALTPDLPLQTEWQDALLDSAGPFLPSLYLGLPALVLVLASRRSPLSSVRRALVLLVVAAAAFALGRHGPVYAAVIHLVPPLASFRYPSKLMLLVAFGWALLAGMGLEAWLGREPARSRLEPWLACFVGTGAFAGAAVALVLPAALAQAVLEPAPASATAPLLRALGLAFLLSGTATFAVLVFGEWRSRRPDLAFRLAAMAGLVAVAELAFAHRSLNLTTPRALVRFRPPVLEGLPAEDRARLYVYEYFLSPGKSRRYLGRDDPYVIPTPAGELPSAELRVLSQRLYPFPPVAARWGFEGSFDVDTRGLFPNEAMALASLLRAVEGTPAHLRLLRLGAVRWVIALHEAGFEDLVLERKLPSLFPEPIRLFRVPDPLPRAYVVGRARQADGPEAWRALLEADFDPARDVVLSSVAPAEATSADFRGTSRILRFRSDRVTVEAELTSPGYVVLVDTYDPGWQASVDGLAVPVLRANVAFRAVHAPAGKHVVEFTYRPAPVRFGVFASLATAGLVLLGAGLIRLRS